MEDISGSFRTLVVETIEEDILKDKKNLVLLGEKIAIHVHIINYCHRHNMNVINDEITDYQKEFPEQRLVEKEYFVEFISQYGMTYESPLYEFAKSQMTLSIAILFSF